MSHTSREKLDLVNRTKKVVGQLEGVLRALNETNLALTCCNGYPQHAARSIA